MFKNKFLKPKFWDLSELNFFTIILLPFSIITLCVIFFKKFVNKKKFKLNTICVGNIYLGGTGKTPLVLKIDEILKKKYKTFIIKKDYDDQIDEQDLLRSKTKLIISKNRIAALKKIYNSKKNVAIFDDGLQEKSIYFDISIVCFNSQIGIGNGKLLPAGPLREQLSELKNYKAVFINGEKNTSLIKKIKIYNKKIKVFSGKYYLKNKNDFNPKLKYLAICGIGNPQNFFDLLGKNRINVKKNIIFPDHYSYKTSDINKISKIAYENNLKIVTTEKDYMKIKKFKNIKTKVAIIDLQIDHISNFRKYLFSNL